MWIRNGALRKTERVLYIKIFEMEEKRDEEVCLNIALIYSSP